ncbi:hypothetical protein [Nitrosophilus labii]|uniref:hypothetical protein n=1 Tax=Nitrosophilus labii TaxID=2706014 RepID=UPI001656C2D6|nr:hypothetical protein [Nitrosophilus labii]
MRFLLLFLIIFNLFANEEIYKAFEDEIKRTSLDFEILDKTYATYNFIGGFADGEYRLKSYKITPIKDNVYKLELRFVKKKGILRYYQDPILYFWYKDNKIVFLSDRGKYRFTFSKPPIKIKKLKDGYEVVSSKRVYTFKIPVNSGEVVLKIRK